MLSNFKITKHVLLDFLIIFIGCFIASIGVNLFLVNAQLLSSGVTGIALMIQYSIKIKSGISIFIINIPLLLLSYKYLKKRFTIYSVFGMISLSLSLLITERLPHISSINDSLIYCIYGGVLCGLGYGLVFSRNGSTGGVDIISMIIKQKYSNFEIGKLGFAINCLIISISAFLFELSKALYTLISIFIQAIILDKVLNGFNSKKLLLIISEKDDDIVEYVIKEMTRGVTSLVAEGEYTHQYRKMLYIAVTSNQMVSLKSKILKIDPKAFITIIDVAEINGKGFNKI